jgi:hypothetical protein
MEIRTDDYYMEYNATTATISCQGSLRLKGVEEYTPIVGLFEQVMECPPQKIIFNLRGLKFLNSAGINVISKFVISVREKQDIQMIIQGSTKIPWQSKSLKNLRRLMPELQLELE